MKLFLPVILFILVIICRLHSCSCYAQQAVSEKSPIRPNIVWIVCEDMSPHLSSFGETVIKTPNLDQLASDGIRYTNAYTVAGVCAPSRNSIITGMYPQSIGGDNMRNYLANPTPEDLQYSPLPPYSIVPPVYIKGFSEYLRMQGYYCTNNAKQDYQFEAPATMWDESGPTGHWRKRKDGVPFFSIFNIGVTHEAQIWERADKELKVDPAKVKVPPYYPDTKKVRRDIAIHLSNVIVMDSIAGSIIKQLKDDGLYDNTIVFFYSDHGDALPFVKREIFARGLHIPLIVKLANQEQKNTKNHSLISGIDLPATVLSLAGVVMPKYMHGQAFLGKQKSNLSRNYVFASKDRMDTSVDRSRTVFDGRYQYIRNYMPGKTYYQDIVYRMNMPSVVEILQLHKNGKLKGLERKWFEVKPAEELYDLKSDPDELNNLIGRGAYAAIQKRLKSEFDKWKNNTPDLHEQPEEEMLRKMWNGQLVQPVTETPVISKKGDKYYIACVTPGASIGVTIHGIDATRNLMNKVYSYEGLLLNMGDTLTITAQRIGYKAASLKTVIKK